MKHKLLALTLLGLCPAILGAIDVTVDGKPNAKIYILEGSCEAIEYPPPAKRGEPKRDTIQVCLNQALFDLKDTVKRMSGAELEIVPVKSKDEIQGNAIVVGALADQCGEKATLPDPEGEAVLVKAQGNRLYLNGGGSRQGVMFAIYEFLRSQGAAWLMPGEVGIYTPEKKTISMPDGKIERAPAFLCRSPWLSGGNKATYSEAAEYKKWQIRNGEQAEYNRKYNVGGAMWHAFKGKKWNKYFEEHPEIAALIVAADGTEKRNRYQLNTFSPHAADMVLDYIRERYKDKPKDEAMSIPIGPADGGGFDMSPESMMIRNKRRDPVTGTPDMTDLIVKFCGDVVERARKEFPNARMGFLLYNMYTDYPHTFKPNKDLYLTMADITHSRLHGACDAGNSSTRAYYKQIIEQWAEAGFHLTYYHYNWNLAEAALPYTRIRITGLDVPWEHKLGSVGYGDENIQQWSASAPGDWLLAQMMWDTTLDWKKVTEDFCRKAYGKGWKPMYDYWMFLAKRQAESSDETGSFFAFPQLYSRKDAQQMRAWMNEAEKLAETPKEKRRVQIAAFCVTQLENYLDFYEAYCSFRFADALKAVDKLTEDCNAALASDYPQTASRWSLLFFKIFLKRFADKAAQYSAGDYKIIAQVPDRMKLLLDPDSVGRKLNYQSPVRNDASLLTIATYTSTVSSQLGLVAGRSGSIWYRTEFTLPKDLKTDEKNGIGLFIGGFDNSVEVFVNGVSAGTAGGFTNPALFDVTDYVDKTGKANSLVICVTRRGNSEVCTGGLIYPSFFFTGPRVPAGKNAQLDSFKIILPGMANE